MLIYVIIYIVILAIIGIFDFFQVKDAEDFTVAGKKQSQAFVTMSFMATMIGASATVGIMGRVSAIGFPAFWWLAVGALGLFLQSVFLSEKIRDLDVSTLPGLVEKLTGRLGQLVVALVIVISWPGIVASQIVAMSTILSAVIGNEESETLLVIVSVVVILYTAVGGQLSVVKTDALQFIVIAISFVAALVYLFGFGKGDNQAVLAQVELLNEKYTWKDLLIQIFIVGGTYLLGPDVVSRNLLAKDGRTAKKSARMASALLLLFSFVIVLIGLWILTNEPDLGGQNPLIYVITSVLPKPVAVLFAIGILSTILSSADTCLVNISSIIEKDILKRDKVWEMRLWALIVGVLSIFMALCKKDIIQTLTGAYSVYAPGVVFPLLIAILAYGKRKICIPLWLLAVAAGGSCGAVNTYLAPELTNLPIIGMGVSLAITLVALFVGQKKQS